MPNVHLKSAAQNIRQAVSDVQLKIQQEKAASDKRIQDMKNRLNQINNEEQLHRVQSAQMDSDAERSRHTNAIQDLEREKNELNHKIFQEGDQIRKIQADLEAQRAEYVQLATDLETRA